MSIRLTYFIGLILVCLILATSVSLQIFDGILPCPLCTLQRLCFALIGLFCLIGIILHKKRWGRFLINSLSSLTAILGIVLAGRQVWLQQFHAADGGECGVSLQYMFRVLPLNEVMQKIFAGSAECSQRGIAFLSLNMAEWALLCFLGFLLLIGYLVLKEFK
jgi:disulfide bond formation protein DsbB